MANLKALNKDLDSINEKIKALTAKKSEINLKISGIVSKAVDEKRKSTGKDSGAIKADVEGFEVTETRRKSISWNTDKLNFVCRNNREVAAAMAKITTFTAKVDDSKFLELPQHIKKELQGARKESLSAPSYALKVKKVKPDDLDEWEF